MIDTLTETTPTQGGHTAGPWGWFGNQSGIYLATLNRGRTYVMGFRRFGLQGAQPTFRDGGIMRHASDVVRFAVGDGEAKGFADAKADRSVYRYDISAIDHPDARLIAAAPDLLEALQSLCNGHRASLYPAEYAKARAAIARAQGGEQ